MVKEVSVCSGVVRVLGKPAGHAALGGSQRPGFLGQMPGIGRPGMVDSVQPFPEVLQGVLQGVPSILQQVVVLLQEGGLALGKFLSDPGEQMTALPPLLRSEDGGVDVVAISAIPVGSVWLPRSYQFFGCSSWSSVPVEPGGTSWTSCPTRSFPIQFGPALAQLLGLPEGLAPVSMGPLRAKQSVVQ